MAGEIPTASRQQVRRRDGNRCFRCGAPTLHGEWHHRRSRSIRDEHTHHPCNGILLCGTCHRWVHAHPLLARISGWIVSRHTALPGDVAAVSHRGSLFLKCDGMFTYNLSSDSEQEQR
jgi:5-methylcytosine-specific restriction protein A